MTTLAKANTHQRLRPYQEDAVRAIRQAWALDKTPLVSMATGGGKTTVLAQLLRETCEPTHNRALVIAHTQEIIQQLHDRIADQFDGELGSAYGPRFSPGIGIVMGAQDAADSRIVIATRQSLHARRLPDVLKHGAFDYFIVDEGHHVAAGNTYFAIRDALIEANRNTKIVGFTATPKRSDKLALAAFYSEIAYEWTILDGIRGGFLIPPTRIKVRTDVDLSGVSRQDCDYEKKQLVSVLDASNWVDLAIDAYLKYAEDRQTIAFFPQVAMSQLFIRKLQDKGIQAAHIDATTDKQIRAEILRDFQAGKVRVVSNMAVLTEGFDAPATSCILWARPTQSQTVLTQAIGRGLRLFPGKKDCRVIDLTPKDTRALTVGTLIGRMITCESCKAETYRGFKICPNCGASLTLPVFSEEKDKQLGLKGVVIHDGKGDGNGLVDEVVSLFDGLRAAWHKDDQGAFMSCSLGFKAGALVIAPPTLADNGQRIRDRLNAGHKMLVEMGENRDTTRRSELLSQMARLERELRRIDHYTLWLVSEPDPDSGAVHIQYIRSNSDLASLMMEADTEVLSRTPASNQVKRGEDWRDREATTGQLGMLRAMRVKFPKPGNEMTRGEVAALITHHQVIPLLNQYFETDRLPERKAR